MDAAIPRSILQVLHTDRDSGPQRSLIPRIDHLRRQGASVTTLVPGPGPAEEVAATLGPVVTGGPEALTIPRSPRAFTRMLSSSFKASRVVAKQAKAVNADLVIVSSALMPAAIWGAKRAGAGVLVYSGEYLPESGPAALLTAIATRFAGRNAGAIITCSDYVAQSYRRRGIEATVIWPPVDAPDDPLAERTRRGNALRQALSAPDDRTVVCSLGAITHGRGQDTLMEAVAQMRSDGIDIDLWIAGEPYNRTQDLAFMSTLRDLVQEHGLHDRVRFLGRVEDTDALFQAVDVFINPARFPEPFGRASIEALLSGCPVISTDVGGVSEALSHSRTALLIPPNSPSDLGCAIKYLLEHPSRAAEIADRGRNRSLELFSVQAGTLSFMSAIAHVLPQGTSHIVD